MKKRQLPEGQYVHNIPALMDENPISFYPNLAKVLGVNEAIVLQQIWFYVNVNRENESERHHVDGKWWVYNSYQQWSKKFFPWLTPRGVQSIILNLEKLNIIESMQGVEDKYDRRKWYTVNRRVLDMLMQSAHSAKSALSNSAENVPSEEQSLHHDNVQNLHEQKTEITTENTRDSNRERTTYASVDASASRFQNPDGSAKWPDSDEVSTLRLEGARANTLAMAKAKAKTKTTTAPAPLPPAPKQKSILAWIIDDAWRGKEGKRSDSDSFNKRLIPVLMGTSKKFDCVEPAASEAEIYGFARWYRWQYPNTSLPMEGKLASWFGQFRASAEYASRLDTAAHMVSHIYHASAPAPVTEEEYVPLDHPVYATLDALLSRPVIGGDL